MAQRPYVDLLSALGVSGVHYAIAGGLAVVLHGVPRMTFDLDLVVALSDENMLRLVSVLKAQGYLPRLPVAIESLADAKLRNEWISERNLIAFSLFHPQRAMEEVDILVVSTPAWSEISPSISRRSIDGVSVAVVGRQALKRMKLAAGRDKDLADAALLGDADD